MDALKENRLDALKSRNDLYDEIRAHKNYESWQLDILGLIPRDQALLSDYMFSVDVLIYEQEWTMIRDLLVDLALSQPVFVEVLYEELVKRVIAAGEAQAPIGKLLEVFVGVFGSLGSDLGNLDPYKDRPFIEVLRRLVRLFPGRIAVEVERLLRSNPTIGSPLATSLLRIISTEKLSSAESKDVAVAIWEAKIATHTATSEDLHNVMLRQIYLGDAKYALAAYDANSSLQANTQADVILLAAAQAKDWDRLQATFENLTTNFQEVLQSRHYGIILRALGELGGRNLLEEIFKRYSARNLEPGRGVYHAMIYSYQIMGDFARARYYFDQMIAKGIPPVRTSFQLMLAAYKEAKNLSEAMDLVHLASAEYHLAVTNQEITTLLSLCANRRDSESAERIFTWAQSLLKDKIDRITYNAYLQVLVECNKLDEAFAMYDSLQIPAGLDTLTILLSAAARWTLKDKFDFIVSEKERLGLRGDAKWYGAVMNFYSLSKDTAQLFNTLEEMKKAGFKPSAGHYSVILDHLTKVQNFDKGDEIVQEVMEQQVTPTFAFYEQWFRMMTAAQKSPGSDRAYQMLSKILDMGVFDATAVTTPRDAAPPGMFKAVVRKLLKTNRFERAYYLLSQANRQKNQRSPEPWKIAALFMEYYDASGRYEALSQAWERFISLLRQTFVPSTGANGQVVFGTPRRYRFDYSKQIDIRIRDLARQHKMALLVSLESDLKRIGLEMSSANLNHLLQELLSAGEALSERNSAKALGFDTRAFDIAESRLAVGYLRNLKRRRAKAAGELTADLDHGNMNLSRKSIAILAASLPRLENNLAHVKKISTDEANSLLLAQFGVLVPILQRADASRERRLAAQSQFRRS